MAVEDKNLFKVALTQSGKSLVIGYYRGTDFSPDEALNLAAWLCQLALAAGGDFDKYVALCEEIESEVKRAN